MTDGVFQNIDAKLCSNLTHSDVRLYQGKVQTVLIFPYILVMWICTQWHASNRLL